MKTVLEMSSKDALEYFLRSSNYSKLVLPKYFNFDELLSFVKKIIGDISYDDCLKNRRTSPSQYDGVNYKLLTNKDGRYAYRPLQLANPYLYYLLAREITKDQNWDIIKGRFYEFSVSKFEVASIPLEKDRNDKSIDATTIKNWWDEIEQRSIELSLEYKYVFITDITNCYGSIYTHSIAWALHGIDEAKSNRRDKSLGNTIDRYIRDMQYGQTNGIPQGGVLFDFIAELILGYSDLLLYEELQRIKISDYKILRYRDDYRIFCNSKEQIEIISVELQRTLAKLNFQLNSSKTKLSEDVIGSSIKADKLHYILNSAALRGKKQSIQKELIYALQFSRLFPNSGSLLKMLTAIHKRIHATRTPLQNVIALIAIITEIAMNNPKAYRLSVSIISELIDLIGEPTEKDTVIKNILNKFNRLPNIGYLQLWMQRITYAMNYKPEYNEPLCKIVEKDPNIKIWNNDWLKDEFTVEFPLHSMYDAQVTSISPVIDIAEVSVFDY